MKFVCYSDWDQLPDSANALFELGEKDSIFFSRQWFENLSAVALDDDLTMLLACVVAGDKVLAVLPLVKSAGKTLYSLKHGYTPIYSLLIADDDQEQVIACLGQGLSQLPFAGLLLEPVDDGDSKINALKRVLETEGFRCDYTFRLYNWIYRVQGQSYEDYMAARPAKLRNTISRKSRKLEREHGYEIRLFTGDEAPQAMSDYYTIYRNSWKEPKIELPWNAGVLTWRFRPIMRPFGVSPRRCLHGYSVLHKNPILKRLIKHRKRQKWNFNRANNQ